MKVSTSKHTEISVNTSICCYNPNNNGPNIGVFLNSWTIFCSFWKFSWMSAVTRTVLITILFDWSILPTEGIPGNWYSLHVVRVPEILALLVVKTRPFTMPHRARNGRELLCLLVDWKFVGWCFQIKKYPRMNELIFLYKHIQENAPIGITEIFQIADQ